VNHAFNAITNKSATSRDRQGAVSFDRACFCKLHHSLTLVARCLLIVAGCVTIATAADDLEQLEQRAFNAAAARVASSVVSIETVGGLETVGKMLVGQGATTGLVVSPDGYIISSAFNFIQKPTSILVGFADGTRAPAKIVATDRSRMLVLLKATVEEKLVVAENAPEAELKVGQWSIAVGRTFDSAQINVSVGVVSAIGRVWGKAVQTDAKISPNNYGGPLVDVRGRVVGVLVPMSPQSTSELAGVEWYDSGIGFAVPMSQVLASFERLKSGQDLYPGILGVVLKQADMFADPVECSGVRPNSPAYKSGFKRGDKIVAVNGREIASRAQLSREINRRYAGESLKVTVARGEQKLERELQLIDKLEPYERPFLGILPQRDRAKGEPVGVVVRYVYADSAAAKSGVKIGDRLVNVGGEAVTDREALAARLADFVIGDKLAVEVLRDGKSVKLELTPAREPTTVPAELPAAVTTNTDKAESPPATGDVPLKIAEHATQFTVYAPTTCETRRPHGVLLWLHGTERPKPENIVNVWKPLCDKHELILVVPLAGQGQWQPADAEAITKALESLQKSHPIDPARIVAHGLQSGAIMAQRLAATQRELIRGVAIVQSQILAPFPENEPATPLSWLVAQSKAIDVTAGLDNLRKAKYTVTTQSQGEKARYFVDAERDEFLRWIDTLDRF
jgi:serine protease Do